MLTLFRMLMRPGAFLIKHYPMLKHVPGYTTELEEEKRDRSSMTNSISSQRIAGPHLLGTFLTTSPHKLSDEEMAYLAGSLFGAGSATTAVAILYVIMASACYPKAQEKMQEHLDIVIDHDRERQVYPRGCNRLLEPLAAIDMYSRRMCRSPFDHAISSLMRPERLLQPDQFDPERWLNSDGKSGTTSSFFHMTLDADPENPMYEMGFVDDVIAHPKPVVVYFQLRFGDEASLRNVTAKYGLGMIKIMNLL
ncbi:cytochrome P450 [Suillus lakei]|nr:cytochrome P450 [Suillus lakei]